RRQYGRTLWSWRTCRRPLPAARLIGYRPAWTRLSEHRPIDDGYCRPRYSAEHHQTDASSPHPRSEAQEVELVVVTTPSICIKTPDSQPKADGDHDYTHVTHGTSESNPRGCGGDDCFGGGINRLAPPKGRRMAGRGRARPSITQWRSDRDMEFSSVHREEVPVPNDRSFRDASSNAPSLVLLPTIGRG